MEELLLRPRLALVLMGRMGWLRQGWRGGRGRRLGLLRQLRLLCWLRARLAVLVFATAPTAPMSLRLPLAVGRSWPQIRLGLRRICRHAFTSWLSAVCCIAFLDSAAVLLNLLCRGPAHARTVCISAHDPIRREHSEDCRFARPWTLCSQPFTSSPVPCAPTPATHSAGILSRSLVQFGAAAAFL